MRIATDSLSLTTRYEKNDGFGRALKQCEAFDF